MQRIEKQRDELEEERIRHVIRKMGAECDLALKKQWALAEEVKAKDLSKLREKLNRKALENVKDMNKEAIKEAIDQAEVIFCSFFCHSVKSMQVFLFPTKKAEFSKREQASIEKTRLECEREFNEKLKQVHESYRSQIEDLTRK
jgi:hypothetical protein